jgi:glycosyltransferase involved in cell wall biosynthesis
MLARFSGAKMLSMMYGIDVWNPLKPVRRWALQQSDQLIAISHFTAQQATAQNGVELAKVRILYNCLAQSFTSQTQHPKQPSTQLSMLTVARMDLSEQYKGHDYVIRAMSQLLERFPDLVYHIIGDGNGRSALEDLAVQEGVAHAVEFHGFVDEETLRKHYTEASLFIMPSRGEGFGFVFLEAMAQGKPVIGGNLDATPEVVVDGKTGYLVNPTSVEEIVSAVTRLLEDSSLRERIGAAAREHVEKDFSFLGFQQQLIDILCDTLSDKI